MNLKFKKKVAALRLNYMLLNRQRMFRRKFDEYMEWQAPEIFQKPVRFDDLKRGDWFTMKPSGNTTVSVYKECDPSDPEGFGYDSAGNEYQGFEKVYKEPEQI